MPAAQARARASSSTRRLRKKVRISVSEVAGVACLEPTSQRIVAKDSRGRPIFSQPALAWRSASSSSTADCTAEICFVELMARENSNYLSINANVQATGFVLSSPRSVTRADDSVLTRGLRLTLGAGTDFTQKFPRIESQVVVIVPRKLDGVFSHAFRGEGLGVGLEHQQRAGSGGDRIAGPSASFAALVLAHGARTSVAQVDEVVV